MVTATVKNIVLSRSALKEAQGVVVFDLSDYQVIERELEGYRQKKRLLMNLKNFEKLARWGREFAKKQGITQKQVFEDD